MSRISKDEWALRLAQITALRATCLRRSVGCVLTDRRGHVLSTGYNGVAAGVHHCNELTGVGPNPKLWVEADGDKPGYYRFPEPWERETVAEYAHSCAGATLPSGQGLDNCQAIHAEQNALLQCRDVMTIHTCYVTTSPCLTCVKLLMNTSCKRIVFSEPYAHKDAALLWAKVPGGEWIELPLNLQGALS